MTAAEVIEKWIEASGYEDMGLDPDDLIDMFRAARYEVVKLPEPDYVDGDAQGFFGEMDIRADPTGSPRYRRVWTDFGLGSEFLTDLSPASARRWGTHFLAAAQYAEGGWTE